MNTTIKLNKQRFTLKLNGESFKDMEVYCLERSVNMAGMLSPNTIFMLRQIAAKSLDIDDIEEE